MVQTGVDECDDGNTVPGDGCSASCELEGTGPDAGPTGPDAGTNPGDGDGGGCCSASTASRDTGLLGGLAILLGLGLRRRRRPRFTGPTA